MEESVLDATTKIERYTSQSWQLLQAIPCIRIWLNSRMRFLTRTMRVALKQRQLTWNRAQNVFEVLCHEAVVTEP